jgi:hypothetical protein
MEYKKDIQEPKLVIPDLKTNRPLLKHNNTTDKKSNIFIEDKFEFLSRTSSFVENKPCGLHLSFVLNNTHFYVSLTPLPSILVTRLFL